MRFETPDANDSDFDDLNEMLAPELAALGDQLGADANYLAVIYPPRKNQVALATLVDVSASQHGSAWRWTMAAALAVLVAIGATVAMLLTTEGSPPGNELAGGNTPASVPAAALPVGTSPSRPVVSPAIFTPDLSGPELEAVLDLLEMEPTSLSI